MLDKIKQKLNPQEARKIRPKSEKGQSLVEMAIITPLLIFFLLGIFEVGYGIRSYLTLVNVNREITRYAVRPGYLNFSTQETAQAGFENVKGWAEESVSEQVTLDFDDTAGSTTLIVSHLVVDTALPCEDIYDDPDNCSCDSFVTDPNYANNYTLDDLIMHPGMPGQQYQTASFGPATTETGSRETRLDYDAIAAELAAQNNKFNCEIIKKGGVPSNNNVIVTEIFHDQSQLFGFPFISNPFTDPVPLYTHTSMRLINGARGYTIENVGPACVAYPITFGQDIFNDPDNPTVPQSIDAYEGDSPGNFGWITWNPDSSNNNANYVEDELRNPRMSYNDFTDALDPTDQSLSIGDNVSTKPGVANSDGVDAQLQLLVGQEIIIPVYDNNPGSGAGSYYHISHFAIIRVDAICLPRNGSKCDGENSKQIKATLLGYADDTCSGSPPTPNPGNNPPVAVDDTISTPENTTVVINVLDNDSDPDGDTLVIESITEGSPFKGTLQITDGNTTITYQPKSNDTGTYTFSYTISDGNGGTDTANVTVVVTSATGNNAPIAVNDNATTNQDTAVTVNFLGNDSDPDGDSITVDSVGTPSNGSVIDNGDGTLTYTPNSSFNGTDSFTYTIIDGNGGSDTATVTIVVSAPNNPPVAANDSATTNQDTAIVINIGSNDSDPDGDSLIFSIGTAGNGSVIYNGAGQVTYTPNPGYSGSDSFSYTINDGNGGSDTATVTVTVTPAAANNAPVANDDDATTNKNTSVTINVISNDSDMDGDALTITGLGTPTQGGSVVDNGDGTVTFSPKNGFKNDVDTFTYTISDGNGGTATATVSVTVTD